jgi:Protein of unknown function (DUF2634)
VAADDLAPYTLLPADDPIDPDDALAAATAEAEADFLEAVTPEKRPFGRSWFFDFETGQFVRPGNDPAKTYELDTLKMWVQTALLTRRFGDLIHSEDFGLEMYQDVIGKRLTGEVIADLRAAITAALLVHDRIADVGRFSFDQDPAEDFAFVSFTVTTDQAEEVPVEGLPLLDGGAA